MLNGDGIKVEKGVRGKNGLERPPRSSVRLKTIIPEKRGRHKNRLGGREEEGSGEEREKR